MKKVTTYLFFSFIVFNGSCSPQNNKQKMENEVKKCGIDTITLGTGCFWCTEAIFRDLKGIIKVTSGYTGGNVKNPSYEDICTGTTGHAEVCEVIFDTEDITLDEILEVFWLIHDPTTPNRQGNDVGTQYRSAIFYHNNEQKNCALEYLEMLELSNAFPAKIVTEISPITHFYKAEDYHANYFNNNKQQPYCKFVIGPKMDKFKKVFADKIKK